MLRYVLRRNRVRLLCGLAFAASLPFWLPSDEPARLWGASALGSLAPWLVIGRDAVRRRDGLRDALRSARRGGRLVLFELLPALTVCAVAALAAAHGRAAPALALFAFTAVLVGLADWQDRRVAHAGVAWMRSGLAGLLWLALPVLAAPAFTIESLRPWPASIAVALHPAGAALAAAGRSTLQDDRFYTWTLSGVVEARPVPWVWSVGAFAILGVAAAALAVRAARRPVESRVGRAVGPAARTPEANA